MTPRLPPEELDLVEYTWAAGRPIVRIHEPAITPNSFNPTEEPGRFRPVHHAETVVPTLYGAQSFDSALSETIFHDVPLSAVRAVPLAEVEGRVQSTLFPRRDLRLAELHGHGLRRLGLRHADIIDFDDLGYRITQAWGQAIYDWCNVDGQPLDGIVWMSRQFNAEEALMLFGSVKGARRVRAEDLRVGHKTSGVPLAGHELFDRVQAAASRAKITIVRPGDDELS